MKRILLTLLIQFTFTTTYSQSAGDFFPTNLNLTPPAPNAASLGKYAEFPVNLYSGIPQIEIPISQIQSGSLTLPISLSYHASGIKVEEIASWVGLGWSLNAGGVVTRTVHGLPDDAPSFGYLSQIALPDPYALNDMLPQDYELLREAAEGMRDWQPDEYYFNFNGRAGQFVMGLNNSFYTIPYQDLQITGNPTTGFTIITEDGTQYIFMQTEVTHTYSSCDGGGDEAEEIF